MSDDSVVLALGLALTLALLLAMRRLIWRPRRALSAVEAYESCPYCPNVNRWDNGNAVSGRLEGNCMYDNCGTGADAPCVCDSRWNHKNGDW